MKTKLIKWLKSHPDVFHEHKLGDNISTVSGWWYVQNFLGSAGLMKWEDLKEIYNKVRKEKEI